MAGAVTILHNPRCSTSRFAVETAQASNREVRIRNYLKDPLSAKEIAAVIDTIGCEPAELVRRDQHFKAMGLTDADVATAEQVVELLAAHPELMQRPVIIRHDLDENRAIIGRPKEAAAAFIAEAGPGFPTKAWPDPDRREGLENPLRGNRRSKLTLDPP